MRVGYLTLMDNPPAYGSGRRDPGQLLRDVVDQSVYAEELGFASAWLPEHHFGYWSTCPNTALALGHIAARTRRIRIGPAVTVLPSADPLRIAEDYAMLDVLSGGRVDFAAGRGFGDQEYRPFGVPYSESRERLREGMDIIRKAWTEDPFSYQGRTREIPPVSVLPKPLQKPHPPMYVGSFSRDSFEMAAAEGYHVMLAAFAAAQAFGGYESAAREFRTRAAPHGHGGARVICSFLCAVNHTREERRQAQQRLIKHFHGLMPPAREGASHPHLNYFLETCALLEQPEPGDLSARGLLLGDAEQCLAVLERCARAGISEVLLYFNFGGYGHADTLRAMERVAKEVLPHVERLGG